ncbi:MAG: hypothetical protein WCF60_04325, partial [Anaerobacillus sp.]
FMRLLRLKLDSQVTCPKCEKKQFVSSRIGRLAPLNFIFIFTVFMVPRIFQLSVTIPLVLIAFVLFLYVYPFTMKLTHEKQTIF